VLVEMLASPVNPSDLNQIEGVYPVQPPLPAVAGNEGVGRVAATGAGVTGVAVGDWVTPAHAGSGTFTWWGGSAPGGGAVCVSRPHRHMAHALGVPCCGPTAASAARLSRAGRHHHGQSVHGLPHAARLCAPRPRYTAGQPALLLRVVVNRAATRLMPRRVRVSQGDAVIQNAANSGVGLAAMQLARAWGVASINIVRQRYL
jgi:NADPH:quinone reductase-like Zn-dependent oxidoreductase